VSGLPVVEMQNIDVRKAIKAGLADSAAGRTVPVDEVRRRFGLSEQSDPESRATEEAASAEAPNVLAASPPAHDC
jgi:hypothetical protein